MAQWQSQTRKMNRHYQSIGSNGLYFTDWPIIQQTIYFYDRRGNTSYVEVKTNKDLENYSGFEFLLYGVYFKNDVFTWEDRASGRFYFDTEKVSEVKKVKKQYQGNEYNATEVHIPMSMISEKGEQLFNASTEEPPLNPYLNSVSEFIITFTDLINQYNRILYVEIKGQSQFDYINDILNIEKQEMI